MDERSRFTLNPSMDLKYIATKMSKHILFTGLLLICFSCGFEGAFKPTCDTSGQASWPGNLFLGYSPDAKNKPKVVVKLMHGIQDSIVLQWTQLNDSNYLSYTDFPKFVGKNFLEIIISDTLIIRDSIQILYGNENKLFIGETADSTQCEIIRDDHLVIRGSFCSKSPETVCR